MEKNLLEAVTSFMKELQQVPGTQLQLIEGTLRQLKTDLTTLNPDSHGLDDLIEWAAIARAEVHAFGDWREPEEPCEEELIMNDMCEDYYKNSDVPPVYPPLYEELPF